ncbi:MAG: hypothetical protein EBU08_17755 [Micrococcales bacterium]|nr:hypothetical protein [Micrococcales bacterium]
MLSTWEINALHQPQHNKGEAMKVLDMVAAVKAKQSKFQISVSFYEIQHFGSSCAFPKHDGTHLPFTWNSHTNAHHSITVVG